MQIKQHSKVKYLGCLIDVTMSGEAMALNIIHKINKPKFLYRKNVFSTAKLRRLLCNVLIQPHFDYACSAWYLNLTKKLKAEFKPLKTCVCVFACSLINQNISHENFERVKWLPVPCRFKGWVNSVNSALII